MGKTLDGKAALVTGGTSGIGLAVAELFAHHGAAVVVTGRDDVRGTEAMRTLRAVGDAWYVRADAADEAQVRWSVEEAVGVTGRLDVLVNNAGVALVAPLVDTPPAEWDRLMAINARAVLLYVQAARPHLAAAGGSVVNVASDAGLRGEQAIGAYSVSKAAVVMMSRLLALDLAPLVRCNCVCPGATLPGMRHIGPPSDPDAGDDTSTWPTTPLGRAGRGPDVAEAVLFLAGRRSAFCTGSTLLVDGGVQAGVPT